MFKNALIAIAIIVSFASLATAKQGELDLQHPDQVLVKAYPGDANTKLIQVKDIKSAKVKKALSEIDLAFEMGDGYYDILSSALYIVFTKEGKVAGFMEAALLSYTEGDGLYLVAGLVNTRGVRVGDLHELNIFATDIEDLKQGLPPELVPDLEQE